MYWVRVASQKFIDSIGQHFKVLRGNTISLVNLGVVKLIAKHRYLTETKIGTNCIGGHKWKHCLDTKTLFRETFDQYVNIWSSRWWLIGTTKIGVQLFYENQQFWPMEFSASPYPNYMILKGRIASPDLAFNSSIEKFPSWKFDVLRSFRKIHSKCVPRCCINCSRKKKRVYKTS